MPSIMTLFKYLGVEQKVNSPFQITHTSVEI